MLNVKKSRIILNGIMLLGLVAVFMSTPFNVSAQVPTPTYPPTPPITPTPTPEPTPTPFPCEVTVWEGPYEKASLRCIDGKQYVVITETRILRCVFTGEVCQTVTTNRFLPLGGQTCTPAPTPTPTPTPEPLAAGTVYLSPAISLIGEDDYLSTSILVDSGDQNVAAFGLIVYYPADILDLLYVDAGSSGLSPVINTGTDGEITAAGFSVSGVGPAPDLELLIISWYAEESGIAPIDIIAGSLTDSDYNEVGTPSGLGGLIIVD